MKTLIKIRLKRSPSGHLPKHRQTVRGLGLRHLYHERYVLDTPEIRGMIRKIPHLVEIREERVTQRAAARSTSAGRTAGGTTSRRKPAAKEKSDEA